MTLRNARPDPAKIRKRRPWLGCVALSLVVTAASSAQTMPAQTRQLNAPTQRAAEANVFSAALLQTAQPGTPPRGQAFPDDPLIVAIDWQQAAIDRRQQAAQTNSSAFTAARVVQPVARPSNPEAAGAQNTRLPVLIPQSAALQIPGDPVVLLFPNENFYTLSITGPDIVIEVFGTRLAHASAPDARAARNLRASGPDGYRIGATEYGQEVNFNRYGAAYSITIECARPQQDARCTNDAYARQIASSLVIAAGSPAEGG